ncbi:MAG: DUF512 domain-containing protein [Chloroflexi bacterium]|nr:DUF512 domain-containing protein [Chloroflexota bacterium]
MIPLYPSRRAESDRLRIARARTAPGGVVTAVDEGSPAAGVGIRPGDRVLEVNGRLLWDVLDYQFQASDGQAALVIERGDEGSGRQRLRFEIVADRSLGIHFGEPTFDGIRVCANKCPFCFVHQNRRGMRRSVYIKDDDYRYSAMYGGFVTLTNLGEDDWQRIAEQRLGPLNVSVHATELELRRRLLGNPKAPDVVEQIERLGAMRVQVNAQVVLCPDWNDGPHLERTIADLASLYPTVQTLSVVPVGLTNYGIKQVAEIRRHTPAAARAVVEDLHRHQRAFRRRWGIGFVYPSDEFYLLAGVPVPSARHYDGYRQYSNGVGMVRSLLDQWARLRRRVGRAGVRHATVVTGTLAGPVLQPIVEELGERTDCRLDLASLTNHFFGPSVTVSGLLTGYDALVGLASRSLGELLVLPRTMLDMEGVRFLDDRTPADLAHAFGVRVAFARDARELVARLAEGGERVT